MGDPVAIQESKDARSLPFHLALSPMENLLKPDFSFFMISVFKLMSQSRELLIFPDESLLVLWEKICIKT